MLGNVVVHEHGSIALPSKESGLDLVLSIDMLKEFGDEVGIVDARGPGASAAHAVAAVVAIGLCSLEAGVISSLYAIIEQASVPRNVCVYISALIVAIASWIKRNEPVLLSDGAPLRISEWPLVPLPVEVNHHWHSDRGIV